MYDSYALSALQSLDAPPEPEPAETWQQHELQARELGELDADREIESTMPAG